MKWKITSKTHHEIAEFIKQLMVGMKNEYEHH